MARPIDLARVTKAFSPAQIRSIVEAQARLNIWSGAIRSGKTVASLLRWLIFIAEAPPYGRLVMVGRTKDTIGRNLFSVLQDPSVFGSLAEEVRYTPGANTARILGRVVDIIGAHDKKAEGRLRGMTCAGAYVDEATLVPQEFFTQLIGRMSVPGSKLFATTNPDSSAHWLRKDFLLRAHEPDIQLRHWHFSLDDNPALDEDFRRSIKASFVGLFYRRFVLGHWVAAQGAVYDQWDPQTMVVDDGSMPLIQRWLCAAVDYGTTNPFAALLLGVGVDQRLYVASEWRHDSRKAHRQLTDAEYSVAVRGWLDRVQVPGTNPPIYGVRPEHMVVDPSAASFIRTMQVDGMTPTPGVNDVLDGIRNVSTLMGRDRLRVHRSCTSLLDELPGYSWDDDKALRGLDVPIKVDDHSLDALRYGIHTTEALWRFMFDLAA